MSVTGMPSSSIWSRCSGKFLSENSLNLDVRVETTTRRLLPRYGLIKQSRFASLPLISSTRDSGQYLWIRISLVRRGIGGMRSEWITLHGE